jgi:hypothetical protein
MIIVYPGILKLHAPYSIRRKLKWVLKEKYFVISWHVTLLCSFGPV